MNQLWLPLECNEPDLHLWSLNVIALLHSENEKMIDDLSIRIGEKLKSESKGSYKR